LPLPQLLQRFDWYRPSVASFFFLGAIDFPIVLLTISLSGMNFPHYYISLFTPLFLLISAAVFFLIERSAHTSYAQIIRGTLLAIFIVAVFNPALSVINRLKTPSSSDARAETAAYLKSVTTPQQKIMQWGWESVIYFLADREPPTRYSFQFPVYLTSPYQDKTTTEVLSAIQADPPAYIADTMDATMPFIQGKSTTACLLANPANGTKFQALLNYVCSHYEYVKSIQEINIYKFNG
jgi:NADH:ubiquinone oxidoreductase subunit K